MKEKMNVGEIIRTGAVLFLITALSAALLAFVNGKTAPLIEKNSLEKEKAAMKAVLPQAADFKEAEITEEITALAGKGEIEKVFAALDENKSVIGACVITKTTGYDVGIEAVTGVDKGLRVTGVEIISMNETPGLGAKAAEESFRSQYKGKSGTINVSKSGADDGSIQAISGATKTSKGVTEGVNIALGAAEILLEGGSENG